MKIKNVEHENNLILAPMAGFTDLAFRSACRKYGAGLTVTEMVSAKALSYNNKKTEDLLLTLDDEKPKAVQIFGHEPDVMAEACKNPLLQKFDIIDINMGCPAPKIISNGDGSSLLKDFELSRKIIEACVNATEKPVTVKFRIGFYDDQIVAVDFAKMCEDAGAAAITVHGRTTKQGYSGKVDYDVIRQVKEAVSIPVFANGDCKSKEDYDKILEITKADGVMIGRAAVGCPEIFAEIVSGNKPQVDKFEQIKWHYETMLKFYPERYVVLYMRSHLAGYLKGEYKNSKSLVEMLKLDKYADILAHLSKIFG